MRHKNLGNIRLKVGEYHDNQANQKRNRSRTVGALWATQHSDGTVRYWIKFHLDSLAPTLAALSGRYVDAGDDTVSLSVFPEDDRGGGRGDSQRPPAQQQQQQPAAATGQRGAPMNEDDIDF